MTTREREELSAAAANLEQALASQRSPVAFNAQKETVLAIGDALLVLMRTVQKKEGKLAQCVAQGKA